MNTWILENLKKMVSSLSRDIFGAKYLRMDQVKFFRGCLPQILFGPFLNTLSLLWPWGHYILIILKKSFLINSTTVVDPRH